MHEDGLDWNLRHARARNDGSKNGMFAAEEEGSMSQGIADWRGKQVEMKDGARIDFCQDAFYREGRIRF